MNRKGILILAGVLVIAAIAAAADGQDRAPFRPPGKETSLGTRVDELVQALERRVAELERAKPDPPGVRTLPIGVTTVTQHVIPRFADALHQTHPAGVLRGYGPGSVIEGTADTQKLPAPMRAVVITEDYASDMAMWQAGAFEHPEYRPAVLQAQVRDLTIRGHDSGVDMLAAGPDLYDGLAVRSTGHTTENVTIYNVAGTACVSTRGRGRRNGQILTFDREKSILRRCQASWCRRGFEVVGNDSVVADLEGQALRDFGIKFSTGATQIAGSLHFWGVGGPHANPGAAVWFAAEAGPCFGGPSIYAESSNIGVLCESSGNILPPIYSHTCWGEACVVLGGQRNKIPFIKIDLPQRGRQPVGLKLTGQYHIVGGGEIQVPADGVAGVLAVRSIGDRVTNLVVSSNGPPCIDIDGEMNYSTWDVIVSGGRVGLDLVEDDGTSRLGYRNEINVRVPHHLPSPDIVVDLPHGWQTKTARRTSNRIFINGVQWWPEKDE